MTIPDEAVQAASKRIDDYYDTPNCVGETAVRAALTAAAPFLQGVKVKALVWRAYEDEQGTPDRWDAVTAMGDYFFIGLRSDGYTVSFDYSDIGTFNNLEAAKACAQADYEARIMSAIEVAPSPRAQALEEAAQALEAWGDIYGDNAAKCVRALSSQPVADGWLPTHRHKKRGTEYALIGVGKMQAENWQVSKDGFDHSIDMEEVAIYRSVDDGAIWVRPKSEFEDGRFETLPASPGASE